MPVIITMALVLFTLPFGWENTLAGFQSQFYFVLLFGILSLWIVAFSRPFKISWFGGILFGILAYLSLASGVFVFAATSVMGLLKIISEKEYTIKNLMGVILFILLFMVEYHFIVVVHAHDSLKATSFYGLVTSFEIVSGWPLSGLKINLNCIFPFIIYAPSIISIILFFKNKAVLRSDEVFLIGLLVFVICNEVGISYGRAVGNLSSRYTDIYIFGLFINFAFALNLVKKAKNYYSFNKNILYFWASIIIFTLLFIGYKNLPEELYNKKNNGFSEQSNTKNFVDSGDIQNLINKKQLDIPYPDPVRLANLLSDPTIRKILPEKINSKNSIGRMDRFVNCLLTNSMYLFFFGLLYLIVSIYLLYDRRSVERSH